MDQTKKPLCIPPEFATYAERKGIFDTYKRLLEQLLINKPDDPISYLIEQLKREAEDAIEPPVPQIIVVGPPSSGKHIMSQMICKKLRAAHITMKSLILDASADMKRKIEEYVRKKEPVPTNIWVQLIKERLSQYDCIKKGWVLEAFPQTREQALSLQAEGIYAHHVVVLDAPDTVLIERAAGKRVDPSTGDVYHVTFDWPTSSEVAERLEEVEGNSEEEVVEKLIVYHRHIDGVLSCFSKINKRINADQPKSDVFLQVMSFLSSQLRSNAPHNPRIVLLGSTGSGKAVQAALLARKYNIVNVNCGQLIKQEVKDESKMGMAIKGYVTKKIAVPDALVMKILKEKLSQLDCVSRGWVLHGYPLTREQAENLSDAGFAPNRVFFLDVPVDSILERLTLRRWDPVTGERYHLIYNPPRTQEIKERLEQHDRDTETSVYKKISHYNSQAEDVTDYYENGQHINADQDPHTVFESIESMICNPLPKTI